MAQATEQYLRFMTSFGASLDMRFGGRPDFVIRGWTFFVSVKRSDTLAVEKDFYDYSLDGLLAANSPNWEKDKDLGCNRIP